ncbi:MAG: S-layer homology domain-containing protein, partial [Romboutsia sp.]|nr:S-layer homology domain-containing protein [Romboutsia sp.]
MATINTSIKVKAEFLDVNNRSTYYDAITYVEDEGIVNGYSDHTFRASMYVTRGEFTKIIINSIFNEIDISNCVQNYFPDVDKQNKFINYICVAKENDIIKGYSDNTYQPEKYITVGEGIKIISNSYGYTDENSLVLPEFENVFMPYIKSLETLNVLPEELNRIGDFITRGEMVEIIYRLKNSIGNKTHTDYLYLNKKTVDVNLLTTPVAMQPIDIVAELSWVEDNIDYADDTHFFKLGVINDFSVSVNGNIMDLNGFDFCVAIYTTRISVGDSLYPSFVYFAFDQSSNTTVTFDSKYYEFNDNILEVDNEIYTPDYEYF